MRPTTPRKNWKPQLLTLFFLKIQTLGRLDAMKKMGQIFSLNMAHEAGLPVDDQETSETAKQTSK